MKLTHKLMGWILSPGAYAVWHSLGNHEEWEIGTDDLTHKTTGLRVSVPDWRRDIVGAPKFILAPIAGICAPFMFDCEGDYRGAIGLVDGMIISGRAMRCMRRIYIERRQRKKRNRAVFALLTVNEKTL